MLYFYAIMALLGIWRCFDILAVSQIIIFFINNCHYFLTLFCFDVFMIFMISSRSYEIFNTFAFFMIIWHFSWSVLHFYDHFDIFHYIFRRFMWYFYVYFVFLRFLLYFDMFMIISTFYIIISTFLFSFDVFIIHISTFITFFYIFMIF